MNLSRKKMIKIPNALPSPNGKRHPTIIRVRNATYTEPLEPMLIGIRLVSNKPIETEDASIAPIQYDPFTARSTHPLTRAGIISLIAEFMAEYSYATLIKEKGMIN